MARRASAACRDVSGTGQRIDDRVRQRTWQPAPDEWFERVDQDGPAPASSPAMASVGHDLAHGPGQGDEPAGADRGAHGVGDGVLQLVRLVEDHDLVFGQHRPPGSEVHAVEVRVDDDDVGRGGPPAGRLGEAGLAERAAGAPQDTPRRSRHRLPRPGLGAQSSSAGSPDSVRPAQS